MEGEGECGLRATLDASRASAKAATPPPPKKKQEKGDTMDVHYLGGLPLHLYVRCVEEAHKGFWMGGEGERVKCSSNPFQKSTHRLHQVPP